MLFTIQNRHAVGNNLRISRILQCLGDFELDEHQYNLLKFLANEVFNTRELISCADSLTRYWVHTIKDEVAREQMISYVESLINS